MHDDELMMVKSNHWQLHFLFSLFLLCLHFFFETECMHSTGFFFFKETLDRLALLLVSPVCFFACHGPHNAQVIVTTQLSIPVTGLGGCLS